MSGTLDIRSKASFMLGVEVELIVLSICVTLLVTKWK